MKHVSELFSCQDEYKKLTLKGSDAWKRSDTGDHSFIYLIEKETELLKGPTLMSIYLNLENITNKNTNNTKNTLKKKYE